MTVEKEKISQVNFKMPEKDKKEVTAIFKYYGLDLSTGIKMYLKEVQHTKSTPLTLKSVTELDRAIAEADRVTLQASLIHLKILIRLLIRK